jgi:hypothetical protein
MVRNGSPFGLKVSPNNPDAFELQKKGINRKKSIEMPSPHRCQDISNDIFSNLCREDSQVKAGEVSHYNGQIVWNFDEPSHTSAAQMNQQTGLENFIVHK